MRAKRFCDIDASVSVGVPVEEQQQYDFISDGEKKVLRAVSNGQEILERSRVSDFDLTSLSNLGLIDQLPRLGSIDLDPMSASDSLQIIVENYGNESE